VSNLEENTKYKNITLTDLRAHLLMHLALFITISLVAPFLEHGV